MSNWVELIVDRNTDKIEIYILSDYDFDDASTDLEHYIKFLKIKNPEKYFTGALIPCSYFYEE